MSTTENNAALIERDYGVVDGRVTTNRILVDEPKPVTAWHPLLRPPPSPVTSATLFSLSLSLSFFFFFFLQTRRLLFRAASPRGLFSSLFFLFFFLNFFRTCTRVIRTSDMRNERERASRKDICAHVDGAAS